MTNEANMPTPVTRDELRDELTQLEQRVDQRFERVDQRFEQIDQRLEQIDQRFEQIDQRFEQIDQRFERVDQRMATKVDLELWGGALMARIEQSEKRLMMELARHTQANHEASMRLLAAIDDKYTDLPGRVGRLEDTVFPHGRR